MGKVIRLSTHIISPQNQKSLQNQSKFKITLKFFLMDNSDYE